MNRPLPARRPASPALTLLERAGVESQAGVLGDRARELPMSVQCPL